jgi:subtilisin family serine protease
MPDFDVVKELDPKLRRLVRSRTNPARLVMDRDAAFVTAEAGAHETTPELYYKRVLVQIDAPGPPPGLGARWHQITEGIYTVDVRLTELEALAARPEVKFIEAGRRMRPGLNSSVPETRADLLHAGIPPIPALTGAGVVVGIIDIGFDFTLADFNGPAGTGTRIAFLWDQSLIPQAGENPPGGFAYGVEYTAAQINIALTGANPFGTVRHSPPVGAHGTHVSGIAAGNGSSGDAAFPAGTFVGVATGATIIMVQPGIEADLDTFADSARVADAVAYIYSRAQQLGLPCVINMSLGQNGGSHDGESVVERAIDRLLEVPGRAFVVAGGNEHVFRTHASGTIGQGQARTLHWRVGRPAGGLPPAPPTAFDRTPNEMEIWFSSRDVMSVRVIDPAGNATPAISPGTANIFTLGGNEVYVDSERFTRLNGDARIYIEMSQASSRLQTGTWQVELTGDEIRGGRFDAWIERDARDAANAFADQSSFEGADFDPTMTLGTPATGRRAIAVANYDHRTITPSSSSGRGGTRDGRNKPECAAPGPGIVSSCARGGRVAANGTTIPMRVTMSGTSMAAPHVTGIVALLFERAQTMARPTLLTAEQTRKLIMATTSIPLGVQVFDPAWGFGRIDAEAAVKLLE